MYVVSSMPDVSVTTNLLEWSPFFAFAGNPFRVDGRILDPICRRPDDSDRVSDEILRWQF